VLPKLAPLVAKDALVAADVVLVSPTPPAAEELELPRVELARILIVVHGQVELPTVLALDLMGFILVVVEGDLLSEGIILVEQVGFLLFHLQDLLHQLWV